MEQASGSIMAGYTCALCPSVSHFSVVALCCFLALGQLSGEYRCLILSGLPRMLKISTMMVILSAPFNPSPTVCIYHYH